MAYQRVWVPELNQFKIIGEDTGEYAQIYQAYPGTTQINIPASTGEILITTPTGMQVTGAIETIGQIADLDKPYEITPYQPEPVRSIVPSYLPGATNEIPAGIGAGVGSIMGIGIVSILSLLVLALRK